MNWQNYIVPSLSSSLDRGHVDADNLFNLIEKHDHSEAYHCLFDLLPRPDFTAYKGAAKPALGFMPLDFDAPEIKVPRKLRPDYDLEKAKEDVLKSVITLGLTKDSHFIMFTGQKGFALYIREEFFNVPHDGDTVKKYQRIISDIKKKHDLKTLDDGIVQANRKFRLPNSKHPKTGLYKIVLGDMPSIEDILERAKMPGDLGVFLNKNKFTERYGNEQILIQEPLIQDNSGTTNINIAYDIHTTQADDSLNLSFGTENIIAEDTGENFYKAYEGKVCVKRMWETTYEAGQRHSIAIVLITEMHNTGISELDATEKLKNWTRLQNIDDDRFDRDYKRVISQVYSGASNYSYGCYSGRKYDHCSGTCGLYATLNKEKRAQVSDIPQEEKKAETKKIAKIEEKKARQNNNFIKGFPDWGDKTPKMTIDNVEHLLKEIGITVRYDVIKKDLHINIPKQDFILDTAKNDKMNNIINFAIKCSMPYSKIPDFVGTIAARNPYNPVAEWLNTKPWDGIDRLQDLFDTVTAVDENNDKNKWLKETLIKRWMISAIAGAFLPNGVSAGGVLVFTGKQYIGKTNWFKNLVPESLGVLKDGLLLDPKDKDSVHQCVSNWLVELGELDATFRKAEIAQLKAFITKDQDTMRLPYQREPASFARRTVFFGSVNELSYLNDPTGNRRFWTINCAAINHSHGLDMQQVWSQIYELFKKGEKWHLNAEEMATLNQYNEAHTVIDPMEHLIAERFDLQADQKAGGFFCYNATEIARVLGYERPGRKEANSITTALRKLGVVDGSNRKGKGFLLCPYPETLNLMKIRAGGFIAAPSAQF